MSSGADPSVHSSILPSGGGISGCLSALDFLSADRKVQINYRKSTNKETPRKLQGSNGDGVGAAGGCALYQLFPFASSSS